MSGILGAIAGSVIGGLFGSGESRASDRRQYQKEKEFAQNSIQWRVADAMKAGIHPLYALGNPGIQAGPSAYGGGNYAGMGQDISRAITAAMDRKEREAAARTMAETQAINNDRTKAEADLYRAQALSLMARNQDNQAGPPAPGYRQSEKEAVGLVDHLPAEVIRQSSKGVQAGIPGSIQYFQEHDGGVSIQPSVQMKQAIEDSPRDIEWTFKNNILPTFGLNIPPAPPIKPRAGYRWLWYPHAGRYYQSRIPSKGRPGVPPNKWRK